MGNSDFWAVAGMPKGGSVTRAVAIVCDSVCQANPPDRAGRLGHPAISALRLPQANAYPSSTFTVPDRSRAAILYLEPRPRRR